MREGGAHGSAAAGLQQELQGERYTVLFIFLLFGRRGLARGASIRRGGVRGGVLRSQTRTGLHCCSCCPEPLKLL